MYGEASFKNFPTFFRMRLQTTGIGVTSCFTNSKLEGLWKGFWICEAFYSEKGHLLDKSEIFSLWSLLFYSSLESVLIFALAVVLSSDSVWSTKVCSVLNSHFSILSFGCKKKIGMQSRGKSGVVWSLWKQTAMYDTELAKSKNQCKT